MKYQSDAHHYRKIMRKKQRMQQLRGALLLVLSFAMMLYAVPGFAKSIWDEGLPDQGSVSTIFSHAINDNAYESVEAAAGEAVAQEGAQAAADKPRSTSRVASKVNPLVSETTGPGILADDEAVTAAKRRAEAVLAATTEKNAYIGTIEASSPERTDSRDNLIFASIALVLGLASACFGVRTILASRKMRGRVISAAYSSALRA